jgi:ABC-2 type transport system permease protein
MSDIRTVMARGVRCVRAEWIKLRSVPSSWWAVGAAVVATVLLGVLVCASVDTSGFSPHCDPGAAGCGDEDVVLNSLSGVYVGQIAVVVLAVVAITAEHATGTVRSTFVANPRRLTVLLSKAAVVAAVAFAVGLAAAVASFVVGQPILRGNGFTGDNGYPAVSLTDGPAIRAIVGSALYLAVVALLGVGVGAAVRRGVAAISTLLGLLYVPMMVALMVPGSVGDRLQQLAPMTAGLSIQRTVERADSVPIAPWAGLGVAGLWALAALVLGAWLTHARDA